MLSRLLVAATLLALALAGCAGDPADSSEVGGEAADEAGDLCLGGCAGLSVAPSWKVGQWWDHHWFFGPQDTTGFVVKAIVVENTSEGYRLATDEVVDAASHAAFYFHDQGLMGPDWVMRDAEGQFVFPWYSFPLTDGKTWTGQEENLDFFLNRVSRQVTMTATAIPEKPGAFTIEMRDGDGLRARYDYQPTLGWFSEYLAFDPTSNGTDYQVRIVNEGQGQGWTGTYYTAQADFLLNAYAEFSPFTPAPPDAPASFTITDEHTHTMVVLFTYAVGGGASFGQLLAPDGQHWEAYATTFPNGGGSGPLASQPFVFVDAIPGEWRYAFAAGDAIYAGGGCYAFGVAMASGTL